MRREKKQNKNKKALQYQQLDYLLHIRKDSGLTLNIIIEMLK